MPRCASTVMKPQTFTPERFFQLSPAQVSLPFSPLAGMEWNVQTSLPVCMSHARTSPAGPSGGFSCVMPPVITRFLYTVGGALSASRPGRPCRISSRVQIDDAVVAELVVRLAGLRIQRVHLAVARSEDDLRRGFAVAGPVFDAAR